jgi:amino acid transporter
MQAISHIAPAVGLVLTLQYITSLAGVASPLAYAIAVLIVLTLGVSLNQLAKHLPSAGGYYTYISRTVHPRAGFLTAWLYLLYDPVCTAINLAFMGYFLEKTMSSQFRIWLPWWLFFIVATLLLTLIVYRGITPSAKAVIFLGSAEIAIVVVLSLFGLVHPGAGGINFAPYLPTRAPSMRGLYLAIVFSIFSVAGYDGVVPLAEESHDPRKTLPQAITASILCTGAFYLFCSWAMLIGWGTQDVGGFIQSIENPCFVLARRLWGKGWILILIAVLNSILAVSIACTNAATRVFFALGRAGVLPSSLSKVHPLYLTPVNAIWLQTAITLGVGLGLGILFGPDGEFYLMGLVITLCLVFIYGASNYGVYRFYRGERLSEFRIWPHLICPAVSTVALIWVGVASLVPLPNAPLRYAPGVIGVWLIAGLLLLWFMHRNGKEDWLLRAGQAAHEQISVPSETAPRL